MQNFEKLGVFYLGKKLDTNDMSDREELLLYNSNDLTTHAAIIGMTGSGKTGLGIALIEEAAMDHIPVLAVDPKGDMANLLLTFPEFRGEQFEPWVDARAAATQGQSVADYAATQAAQWQAGLAEWGQTPARVAQLRSHCDFTVYTPGSSAGVPLALLGTFRPPAAELRDDRDLYTGLIAGTVTALLSLLDLDTDPVTSKPHILISNILHTCWDEDRSLDLAELIAAIQNPPCRTIGVLDVDSFLPAKQRFELALRINSLLAAPGFAAWMEGEAFDIDRLLYSDTGKPRVSVLSIAHLNDRERMFFVTMLLHAVLAWMRRQSGSSTLRALLYIDELFGFMPPVANPASKEPLLTLLKQARAFGLGLVLSTQNPVDLDYRGLSNIGSWFIGRLQTERDRQRLTAGLQSAQTSNTDVQQLDALLAGLGKRCFLLNNVHEKSPVVFRTRWVMSYLAGPLSREQIRQLANTMPTATPTQQTVAPAPAKPLALIGATPSPPVLEPGIHQTWLSGGRMARATERVVYAPELLLQATVHYNNVRNGIDERHRFAILAAPATNSGNPDWDNSEEMPLDELQRFDAPAASAYFATLPSEMTRAANFGAWEKQLRSWLRTSRPVRLLASEQMKLKSRPGESERDFRIRLQLAGNEQRDIRLSQLRQSYEGKAQRLETRLQRAMQSQERKSEQATSSKVDAALSFGTALLGTMLGRKPISATTLSRAGTAARRAGAARRQSGDVQRAGETVMQLQTELENLKQDFEEAVAGLTDAYSAQDDELREILVRATAANITIDWCGIAWRPQFVNNSG